MNISCMCSHTFREIFTMWLQIYYLISFRFIGVYSILKIILKRKSYGLKSHDLGDQSTLPFLEKTGPLKVTRNNYMLSLTE